MDYINFEEFKKRYNIKKSKPPIYRFSQQLYKKIHTLGNNYHDKNLPATELEFDFFHNDFDSLFDHVTYYRDFDGQMIVVTHPYTDFERFTVLAKKLEEFLLDCGVACKVETYNIEFSFYGNNTVQGIITFIK